MESTGMIYKAIPAIMLDLSPVAKDRANQAQNYKFRGIDDVYKCVQAVMAKHGVFCVPQVEEDRTEERQTQKGSALIYRVLTIKYVFYAADGSSVSVKVIGEGMDSGDKASNKAMSVAQKYALIQIFCIPTTDPNDPDAKTDDPENDSHDVRSKSHPTSPQPAQQSRPGPTQPASQPATRPAVQAGSHDLVDKVITQWIRRPDMKPGYKGMIEKLMTDCRIDNTMAARISRAIEKAVTDRGVDDLQKVIDETKLPF